MKQNVRWLISIVSLTVTREEARFTTVLVSSLVYLSVHLVIPSKTFFFMPSWQRSLCMCSGLKWLLRMYRGSGPTSFELVYFTV